MTYFKKTIVRLSFTVLMSLTFLFSNTNEIVRANEDSTGIKETNQSETVDENQNSVNNEEVENATETNNEENKEASSSEELTEEKLSDTKNNVEIDNDSDEDLVGETESEPEVSLEYRWEKIEDSWYYKNDLESLTGWELINEKWYYLNEETGEMETGWQFVNGNWFYLNSSGEMLTGWQKITGDWYYFGLTSGIMQTEWIKLFNNWYYLDPNSGAMVVGWAKINNIWYYLQENGKMKTGWLKDNNEWYLLRNSGSMAKEWQKVNGRWYYMGYYNGVMQTGWLKDRDDWYFLSDPNGHMLTGEYKVGNSVHLSSSSGRWLGEKSTVLGNKIVSTARKYLGYRYVWASTNPNVGFDCSGLTYYIYNSLGINIPRMADAQGRRGVHVSPSNLQPGDLLFFGSSSYNISHVGIYSGNGKVIHALNPRVGVIENDLWTYWNGSMFRFARRVTN